MPIFRVHTAPTAQIVPDPADPVNSFFQQVGSALASPSITVFVAGVDSDEAAREAQRLVDEIEAARSDVLF